jgi:tetrahydromethanopterin S-methyltransferase subunit B
MSDSVGFWKRLFAGVLDGIIISAPLAIIFGVIFQRFLTFSTW